MPFWKRHRLPARVDEARADPAHAGNPDHEQRPGVSLDPGFFLSINPAPPYLATLLMPCGTKKLLTAAEAWELLVGATVSRVHREQFLIPLRF